MRIGVQQRAGLYPVLVRRIDLKPLRAGTGVVKVVTMTGTAPGLALIVPCAMDAAAIGPSCDR
jgi:hypothetical protein